MIRAQLEILAALESPDDGAAAVSVVATLLVDTVEEKSTDTVAVSMAAAFAVMLLLWAGFILTGLRRLAEEYPVALKLLRTGGQ